MPVVDQQQDWTLESGFQNDTHTCLVFGRPFLTCDYDTDLPITNDVTKLIWAYDTEDPIGSEATISKHAHSRRGHRSVHLLNPRFDNSHFDDGRHYQTWDITSHDVVLPNNSDTTYWCKIVTPPFSHKAHVVRVGGSVNVLAMR